MKKPVLTVFRDLYSFHFMEEVRYFLDIKVNANKKYYVN